MIDFSSSPISHFSLLKRQLLQETSFHYMKMLYRLRILCMLNYIF